MKNGNYHKRRMDTQDMSLVASLWSNRDGEIHHNLNFSFDYHHGRRGYTWLGSLIISLPISVQLSKAQDLVILLVDYGSEPPNPVGLGFDQLDVYQSDDDANELGFIDGDVKGIQASVCPKHAIFKLRAKFVLKNMSRMQASVCPKQSISKLITKLVLVLKNISTLPRSRDSSLNPSHWSKEAPLVSLKV